MKGYIETIKKGQCRVCKLSRDNLLDCDTIIKCNSDLFIRIEDYKELSENDVHNDKYIEGIIKVTIVQTRDMLKITQP